MDVLPAFGRRPSVSEMPPMRAGTRRRVRLLLRALCLSVLVGVIIGGASGSMHPPQFLGLVRGAMSGAITGAILAVVIGGTEIFLPQTRLGQALDRAPFLVTFAAKWIVYSGVIVLVLGSMLGRRIAAALLLGPERAQALDSSSNAGHGATGV